METENWYLEHKSGIMRQVRFALPHYRKHFVGAYGKPEGEAIARETLQRFEVLLPDLPYIGGDENRYTRTLYLAAAMLAMYRSLQERGASVEEAARLIYLGTASFFNSVPTRWLMRWQGRRMLGRKRLEQFRHAAAKSQQRRYPDDWVFEVVESDGHDFDFGVDYTECGIVRYLAREGAPELAPYLCWIDYPQIAAMRLRLMRPPISRGPGPPVAPRGQALLRILALGPSLCVPTTSSMARSTMLASSAKANSRPCLPCPSHP